MNVRLCRPVLRALLGTVFVTAALARPVPPLQIYFIDVEGGQSTLVVSPSRRSLLIDAGFKGGRDAERIMTALKAAGIKKLDYMLVTHYHGDHVGGIFDL